jgi:hypothetical protein
VVEKIKEGIILAPGWRIEGVEGDYRCGRDGTRRKGLVVNTGRSLISDLKARKNG